MIAHQLWKLLGLTVSRPLVELLSGIALSLLIASAVATMSLTYISSHLAVFGLLAVTGVGWILLGFMFLAPRMFKRNWFQNGIVNAMQSMGMTATGLLFLHMVDPEDKTNSMESFGYKQLLFEPFVGGGIVTALSMPLILQLGLPTFTAIAGVIFLVWLLLGLLYFGKR
jgi:ESS family glutamate:Na+ symporter